jgi:hypothetical protein
MCFIFFSTGSETIKSISLLHVSAYLGVVLLRGIFVHMAGKPAWFLDLARCSAWFGVAFWTCAIQSRKNGAKGVKS